MEEVLAELERRHWARVVAHVANDAGSTLEDVCAYSARPSVARARFRAWAVVRYLFAASYLEIGDLWGYHHTSVIYGVRNADTPADELTERLDLRAVHARDVARAEAEAEAEGAA